MNWKLPTGEKPISELTNQELAKAEEIATKKINKYYNNYEFMSKLLNEIDQEITTRINEHKQSLMELQPSEC